MRRLTDLPVGTLKIDMSFVHLLDERRETAIVSAVLLLAHNLRMDAVAEGIETAQQQQLHDLGCQYGQGYHLGRPVPAAELTVLLTAASRTSPDASVAAH